MVLVLVDVLVNENVVAVAFDDISKVTSIIGGDLTK